MAQALSCHPQEMHAMLLRVRHIQMQKETDIPDDQLPACMNPRQMQEGHVLLQSSLHDYVRNNNDTLLSSKCILTACINICMFQYHLRICLFLLTMIRAVLHTNKEWQ